MYERKWMAQSFKASLHCMERLVPTETASWNTGCGGQSVSVLSRDTALAVGESVLAKMNRIKPNDRSTSGRNSALRVVESRVQDMECMAVVMTACSERVPVIHSYCGAGTMVS